MADRLITPEAAAAHIAEHCPNNIEVTMFGRIQPEYVCGCGHCPAPDPTPEQLQRRVNDAAWRKAADTDG